MHVHMQPFTKRGSPVEVGEDLRRGGHGTTAGCARGILAVN